MKKKILVMTRNVEFIFNRLRYEWPLEEQAACCKAYIKANMPEADVSVFSAEALDLKKPVSNHKSATILIPSRLIFGDGIEGADKSVAVLRQIGFNVIEAIPNAKLTSIPEDNSHLMIAGDSKITSYCSLCWSANTNIPLKLTMDSVTQHYQIDKTLLTDLYLVSPYLYRPTLQGLIERSFLPIPHLPKPSSNQAFDKDFPTRDVDPTAGEE